MLTALLALATMPVEAQTAPAPPPPAATNGVGSAFELTFWQSVTATVVPGSEDTASYEAYLARYPDGTFSGLARARIAALQRAMTAKPALAQVQVQTPAQAQAQAQAPIATPAVLITPPATMPTAAVAAMEPAPAMAAPAAAMIPAAISSAPVAPAPLALAEAAPSPLARLLAQLRGSGEAAAQTAAAAPAAAAPPQIAPTPLAQALAAAAPGLAAALPAAPAAPTTTALTSAAVPAASYASARPLLLPVPDVTLPAAFCGSDARNQFHSNAYRPAVEAATRNNEAAVTYLRQLQQTYDRGQLGRDTAVLNAIAAEARAYQAEAAQAYAVQAALVRQFDALMAVPLQTCAAPAP